MSTVQAYRERKAGKPVKGNPVVKPEAAVYTVIETPVVPPTVADKALRTLSKIIRLLEKPITTLGERIQKLLLLIGIGVIGGPGLSKAMILRKWIEEKSTIQRHTLLFVDLIFTLAMSIFILGNTQLFNYNWLVIVVLVYYAWVPFALLVEELIDPD